MKYFIRTFFIVLIILVCTAELFSAEAGETVLQQYWSTYCGGSNIDYVVGAASNSQGEVAATGVTRSSDFPVTAGAFQTIYAGDSDLFIIKFNSLGQRLWSTYYGGSGSDEGRNVSFDESGNIYIVGITNSNNFPVSPGAQQPNNAGGYDAFVLKFSSSGQRLWATYLGGSSTDRGLAVSTDNFGNSLVTGYTSSINFPVSPGAFQISNAGGYDVFIAMINSVGQRVWSTFYGGNSDDCADEMHLGNNGKHVVTGYTMSNNFPVTPGCFQSYIAGYTDVFIVCFNTSGARNWATYYGGTDYDYGYGSVSITANSEILACGWTKSTNFPVTANAFQLNNAGGYDAYLLKFDSSGNRLWATYCGGSSDDKGEGVFSDSQGSIFIAGFTNSTNFPVVQGALQTQNAGGYDAFLVKFNSLGQRVAGTYYGGSIDDFCHDLLHTPDGEVLISGKTSSIDFPVSSNCFQNHNSGQTDAFISLLNSGLIGVNIISSNAPSEFSLSQNYPNPFNPSTIINYELPITNYVKLSVYDILGREIAVLLNEKQQAGIYKVEWDGCNYPSGIYFYKLVVSGAEPLTITDPSTGSGLRFSEAKKMILLK